MRLVPASAGKDLNVWVCTLECVSRVDKIMDRTRHHKVGTQPDNVHLLLLTNTALLR